MNGDIPFKVITNDDIYKLIQELSTKVDSFKSTLRWHSWAISFLVVIIGVLIAKSF